MTTFGGIRAVALAISLLVPLGPAAGASAAQRVASPTGSEFTCSSESPCSLQFAVEGASAGDEVIVTPGTYVEAADPLTPTSTNVDIHGLAGQPTPVIIGAASSPQVELSRAHQRISDVRIEHTTDNTSPALLLTQNAQAFRVDARSTGVGCALRDLAVIRDSICAGGTDDFEAGLFATSAGQSQPLARNVTAIGGTGVLAQTPNQNQHSVFLALRNVIALGSGSEDVKATNFGGASGFVEVVLENSNYDSAVAGSGTVVTPAGTGTNQTAAPAFVDAAGGDYRQAPGSPTIDAGATDAQTGTLDFERDPRPQGVAVDIGADELAVDTTPPDTTITAKPKRRTRSRSATFAFASTEPGSTFECLLDDGSFKPCTSAHTFRHLERRGHRFKVRATDAAGNTDASPAVYSWKVK